MTAEYLGRIVVAADGRHLDADPRGLDVYGVTLDVFRESRLADFAPPEYRQLVTKVWAEWVQSEIAVGDAEWIVARPDGARVQVRGTLTREAGGRISFRFAAIEEGVIHWPAAGVQAVLRRWRQLERELATVPSGDWKADRLRASIDALREEYRRRTHNGGLREGPTGS